MLSNLLGGAQFSKPTPKELESALLHNVHSVFADHHPLNRYICTVCVYRYISERNGTWVSKNYEPFVEKITEEVAYFSARYLPHVRVFKAFKGCFWGQLISATWWLSQGATQQKNVAANILLSKSQKGVFFDTRMLSDRERPVACELLEGGRDIDTWLLDKPEERNSMEDVAMAITEYLIIHGFKKGRSIPHDSLHPFIKQWLAEKKRKQDARIQKTLKSIESKLTPTRISRRLQLGLPLAYDIDNTPASSVKKVTSLSMLPDMLYDTMLNEMMPPESSGIIRGFPPRLRTTALIIMLESLLSRQTYHIPTEAADAVLRKNNFRLFLSGADMGQALLRGLQTFRDGAADAIRIVIGNQLRHIQKLSFLSEPDRGRLQAWSFNYRLAQCRLEHNFTPERLHSTNPVLSLYLSGRDKGATAGRLRKLFESLLGDEPQHDVFHQHLRQLSGLFRDWPDNHAKHLNKILDLIQSQIGGGRTAAAQFNHWDRFSQIAKGAPTLSLSDYHNLQGAVEISAMSTADIVLFNKSLKQKETLILQDRDVNLLKTASSMGLLEAMPAYLRSVKSLPRQYEFPAIDHMKGTSLGALHVEIRPHNDLVGIMGISSRGVCIHFGGPEHKTHWNNAVAHLIIRDDEKIWMWGLLIRDQQQTITPQYFLNNLQGALPSRYAKQKALVADTIRNILGELGHVFFKELFFNAISLTTDELAETNGFHPLTLPNLRLDIAMSSKDDANRFSLISENTMVLRKEDSPPPEFEPFVVYRYPDKDAHTT